MAEAILQILLDNLSSLIKEGVGSYMGTDDEMNKLSNTLIAIQSVLEDAEDKQLESKPIRNWLRNLNDLAFEIEDVLDECATEASKSQQKHGILNFGRHVGKILNQIKIGSRLRAVTDKLDAVAWERKLYDLRIWDKERQNKADTTRETGSVLNEPDHIYGRDEDKEKIVNILVNNVRDTQQLSILPIIGIGGLGKTTLAQLVYNHPRVTEHFEKQIWVCVSDDFDVKTLVKAIIESVTGNGSASDLMQLNTLQRRLVELLNGKRYLLILDDVWNDNQQKWDELKGILACGSKGASIVVTTRLRKVADLMKTLQTHHLSGLPEEHCWSLFRQRAFGQEKELDPKLEAIGRQIVKKCAGAPLAAKALGGLLRFKREEKEWLYVNESEIWNFPHEEALILPVLRLSYQHLPLLLRQCFAYCAVYPKDHKIEKEELIYCWMAHGYISPKERMDVEDVGNEVCKELVLRSLIEDAGKNYYRMHDLVHDLAQSVMENKVPGAEVAKSTDRSALSKNKIRQVNVRDRYVAFPGRFYEEVNISYTLKHFNRLRMFDASETVTVDLPSEIDKLKQLRYLNLRNTYGLHTLPDTICSIWNLHTLNLNGCRSLVELPKSLRYMKNLRHLLLYGCSSLREMPPNIGEVISLKTLTLFVVGHETDNQLDQLKNLDLNGRLEIKHLERVRNHASAKIANLGEKSNLRKLVLGWETGKASEQQQQEMDDKLVVAIEPPSNLETLEINGFRGRYFPPWTRMENVTEIKIKDCSNCLRLPHLGDLPRLKMLVLMNLGSLEYVMEINEVRKKKKDATILFPSLGHLYMYSLPKLKGLMLKEEEEEGLECLKTLKELDIDGCDTLKCLPWLRHLTALETLKIHNCKELEELLPATAEGKKSLLNSSLKSLELYTLPKMKECLSQHLSPSLESLQLWFLPELTSLPEWLGNFTSLQHLNICDCPRLTSLPPSIKGMTNLKTLYISCKENGELKRRCEKEKGEDWHLISHIPKVRIY